jgi:hypothetical protein
LTGLWEFLETNEFVAASRDEGVPLHTSSAPWLSIGGAGAVLSRSFDIMGDCVMLFLRARLMLMSRKLGGCSSSSSVALRLRECDGRSGVGVGSFGLLLGQSSLIAHHVIGGRGCSLRCLVGFGLFMAHQELVAGYSGQHLALGMIESILPIAGHSLECQFLHCCLCRQEAVVKPCSRACWRWCWSRRP